MSVRLLTTTLAVSLSLPACRDAGRAEFGTGNVHDSAGIVIVENASPAWSETDAWRLSETPTLSMGVAEGDPDHEFYQIRGALRLTNGSIVVANGGTNELKYYAPDGTYRLRAGGKGGGPGEFQLLSGLRRLAGDSLLALDPGQRRASVYDASGRHARDFATGNASTIVSLLLAGQLHDGTYIAQATNVRDPAEMLSRPEGPTRDSLVVLHLDPEGAPLDTLGVFPGPRMNIRMLRFGGRELPMPTMVPFSPTTDIAVGQDRVYVGVSETYEIAAYSPTGELRRLIRKVHVPRAVSPDDANAVLGRVSEALDRQSNPLAEQLKQAYADLELPETLPAFARLLVDSEGNLWVADYPGATDEHRTWTVFDRDGRLLGTVAMPTDFTVGDVGPNYVLGYGSDELEIERVFLYRLIKPAAD